LEVLYQLEINKKQHVSKILLLALKSHAISQVIFLIEIALAVYIFYIGMKSKKLLISILVLLQAGALLWFEYAHGHVLAVQNNFFIDAFSIIMALIVGVIGSLIAMYSLGYMESFHQDYGGKVRDRRSFFLFYHLIYTKNNVINTVSMLLVLKIMFLKGRLFLNLLYWI
jgi:ech hydrogenase subunit A